MYSFKIASRSSPLACSQVEEIIAGLKARGRAVSYELIKIKTSGDKDKSTPLTNSPDNFFTDDLDQALLANKADIAVHSAKDLPKKLPEGLDIFALTQCLDNRDAWVGAKHWHELQSHAKVGTSSLLRQAQILQLRPDMQIVDVRGTIGERLELVKKGQIDGVVVAVCALKRLKLESEIKDIFPWEGQALQGQLAVVGRRPSGSVRYEDQKDQKLKDLFSVLDARSRQAFLHCGTHPEIYRHLGRIIHWPMIEIKGLSYDEVALKEIAQSCVSAHIIIFTSRYAVEHFFKILPVKFVEIKNKNFAVVGQQTMEALQKFNIKANIVAKEETAEGLLKAITQTFKLEGQRILFPRSSLPNPFLKDALTASGAIVDEVTVYENIKPAKRALPSEDIAGVIFTSPSTVHNFLSDYAIIPKTWAIWAKGPHTLKTLNTEGYSHAASLS